jgi:hypothetical protein
VSKEALPQPDQVKDVQGFGTTRWQLSFIYMIEPLPILMEKSIEIAWDYLERTGLAGGFTSCGPVPRKQGRNHAFARGTTQTEPLK